MVKKSSIALMIVLTVAPSARAQLSPRATLFDAAVRAACSSIVGVSVGDLDDKATWQIHFAEGASSQCRDAAAAALAAFDLTAPANNPVYVQTATLLSRLTDQEYANIFGAAQVNAQIARWLDMARTNSRGVNLNDPVTGQAKAALVGAGLLTAPRAAVIFAP